MSHGHSHGLILQASALQVGLACTKDTLMRRWALCFAQALNLQVQDLNLGRMPCRQLARAFLPGRPQEEPC